MVLNCQRSQNLVQNASRRYADNKSHNSKVSTKLLPTVLCSFMDGTVLIFIRIKRYASILIIIRKSLMHLTFNFSLWNLIDINAVAMPAALLFSREAIFCMLP